ncbi:MAG TPA: Xaa-Pro dipeptidyl-peptidase [Longimicrobium sp.]|jgi:X-Pro dipeptidyl-peptidase|uniref:Xaa-Pro dipeptidyl-peptidase n=1 Tax=Longimicrobium sp. TaxID=2029185 RepID=UPI002ED87A15
MTPIRSRRAGLAAALTLACAAPLGAQAAPQSDARPVFQNGMAQVVPAFADSTQWIRQNLWVETDFDSDRDGRMDRVHVDVTRPGQTASGLKVPVVYGSSPYYAGTSNGSEFWNVRQELGQPSPVRGALAAPRYDSTRTRISDQLVRTWVPRGFAVVHSEAPGTGRSQGCATIGDTPERTAMKFVVDWLNGRARGYTTRTGGEQVSATSWSTGKVGMMGTSYEGTLPLATATTGVQGLEVVIPVSANTSYYDYYRANGLVRSPGGYLGEDVDVLYDFIASGDPAIRAACDRIWKAGVFAQGQDRATGDYNSFWAARELMPHLGNVKAAVLLAHGLNDFNVMPSHSVHVYEALKARGIPVSMYLHQGGHGGNPPADMVNRWFTHYLYGVDNGVERDPPVWIVSSTAADSAMARARAGQGRPVMPAPVPFASFPAPGSAMVRLYPTAGGNGVGPLALRAGTGRESLTDDASISGSANAGAARSDRRLLFATAPLADSVRISGTPRVTVRVSVDRPAANLSVWLVTLPYDSAQTGSASRAGVVTRGWADIQNHASLTAGGLYRSTRRGEPLVPGRFYDVTFDLEPDDQVIPAGKQLAVMIMSSDPEFTLWPRAGARLTVDLAGTSISLPVVGGSAALTRAGGIRGSR